MAGSWANQESGSVKGRENGSAVELQDTPSCRDQARAQEEDSHTEDKEDDADEGVPVDRGWAWVISISSHLLLMLAFGFDRALSVLFVDISELFGQSVTVTSLMFTIEALSGCLAVLFVTNVIMQKYSVRTMCCVAALSTSVVTVLISQAPNIVLFLLLFSLKGALFQPLIAGPISLIGYYFKKRRALAASIANAGLCTAYVCIPPITEQLRSEFGTRGCLLIYGGLELHLIFFSLLLRPVGTYKRSHANKMRRKETELKSNNNSRPSRCQDKRIQKYIDTIAQTASSAEIVQESIELLNHSHQDVPLQTAQCSESTACNCDKGELPNIVCDNMNEEEKIEYTCRGKESSRLKLCNLKCEDNNSVQCAPIDHKPPPSVKEQFETDSRDSMNVQDSTIRAITQSGCENTVSSVNAECDCELHRLTNSICSVIETEAANGDITNEDSLLSVQYLSRIWQSSAPNDKASCSISVKEIRRTDTYGSRLSHLSGISFSYSGSSFVPPGWLPDVDDDLNDDEDGDDNNNNRKTCCALWLRNMFDLSLFKIWRFRVIALYMMFGVFSNFLNMYMPAIGHAAGISKSEAALLLSMCGVMDLGARVVMGFIGDYPWLSISKLVACSTLVIALICQLTRFISTYVHFVVFAVVLGSCGGIRQNFYAVMLLQYIGVEKFSRGFGIIAMLVTLSLAITFPIVGAMVDATGSFVAPLHLIGATIFLVSIVMLFEPVFRRLDERNGIKGVQ